MADAIGRRPFLIGALTAPLSGACARQVAPPEAPSGPALGQADQPVQLAGGGRWNVTELGAAPDGQTDCSAILAEALSRVEAGGGGTLVFPSGVYLTGPLKLVSNLTLWLEAGSVLKFRDDFDSYLPMVPMRWEGTEVVGFSPLLYADGIENVSIRGRGYIDGRGHSWWSFFLGLKSEYQKTGKYPTDSKWQQEFLRANPGLEKKADDPSRLLMGFLRPPLIQLRNSKNILIEGVTLQNSPFWTINPVGCDNLTVTGVTIRNPEDGPNTDGINPESCSNVHISNCHIDVGDDCITIKSGRDTEGRRLGRPAESYTIANSTMLRGHGGVVIGSEMSGSVRKIVITNCTFDGTDRGIRVKSTRGRGGVVEEMRVSNIVMKNIRQQALVLNMFYTDAPPEPVSERTPSFRNIHVSGVTGHAEQAGLLLGLPENPLTDVSLSDINLVSKHGLVIKDARDIALRGVRVDAHEGPAISAERVENLELEAVGSLTPQSDAATLKLVDVEHAYVHDCFVARPTKVFMSVEGEKSQGILLADSYLARAEKPVELAPGLGKMAVTYQK